MRLSHGCKIYFDPVSTAAREVFARKVAREVCADPASADNIDTVQIFTFPVFSSQRARGADRSTWSSKFWILNFRTNKKQLNGTWIGSDVMLVLVNAIQMLT